MSNNYFEERRNEVFKIQSRKVVEHNDLIMSVAKMDRIPLKIFDLAVSCIDINNPPADNIVSLSKKMLFAFFDVNDSNKNHRFKEAIEKMQKQAYFLIKKQKQEDRQSYSYESIVPIPYIRWNDYDDEVTIEFNHRIMPYLIDLKSNFTKYALIDIVDLSSKYSLILYKWLSMHFNQFEYYKDKSTRTHRQLNMLSNPQISIEELRRLTDTENDYKAFSDFEKRVLKIAKKEINEHTHFSVDYIKIKNGRKIEFIQFSIQKKLVAANSFYKEEQQDPLYIEEKRHKEQQKKDEYIKAQQNNYTKELLNTSLIDYTDLLDMDLMISLLKHVYPLYKELENLKELSGVIKHLEYVKENQKNYSNKNKSKYLRLCIEDYLSTLDFKKNFNDIYGL